ncbi:MAG: TonB-dependent receptor [Campylobacterales bacterium]
MIRGSLVCAVLLSGVCVQALAETQELESVSITASREERATRDVPQSVAVIEARQFEDKSLISLKDALSGTPGLLFENTNGSASGRVVLRGAGLKARFGVREIMLLRDGVPLTDPDSFTKLDFVDTQDIDRIEVTKGPADLYSPGTTGGAIHIFSKSPFDKSGDQIKLGAGEYGYQNAHLRKSFQSDNGALSVTLSHRAIENGWREWNEFDTTQASIKYGRFLESGALNISELAYTDSNVQLPGSMDAAQFEAFEETGEQTGSNSAFKHSGRYSQTIYFNNRTETTAGAWTLQPKVFYYGWKHFHPVTGAINETQDWVHNFGLELEGSRKHALLGMEASQTLGATLRYTTQNDTDKYAYADVATGFAGRITETLSDTKGDLLSRADSTHLLYGVFGRQSLKPSDRWLIDLALRMDRSAYEQDEINYGEYTYSTGKYTMFGTPEETAVDKTYTLLSPKIGASYRLAGHISLFAQAARGDQLPSDSELTENPDLKLANVTSYEAGVKWRSAALRLDASVYQMTVKDEITQVNEGGVTAYVNAGETDKKGAELSLEWRANKSVSLEAGYAYTDYTYTDFTEPVRTGMVTNNEDRSGNRLPFVPKNQYMIGADFALGAGFGLNVRSVTWGEYYMDNANTEKYEGYAWLTGLSGRWERGAHRVAVAVENLFDKRYAAEVTKDTSGNVSYKAGSPRTVTASYAYRF